MNKSMNKKSINLSAVGLKNVVINEDEKFKFIIGEKEIQMNKFFAQFISPTVSHIHRFDPTINSIDITQSLKKKNQNEQQNQKRNNLLQKLSTEHTLTQILNLSEGQYIEIENKSDLISLRYFSILLNNDELLHKIDSITANEEISDEELLEEISFLSEIKSNMNENIYSKLIDEISSRISDNNKNLLKKVPKHILYLILHNEHFKYDNYDTLFEIINEIFSKENISNDECKEEDCINSFYEQIDINKLNKNNYEEFINNLSYSEMTSTIWEQLRIILLNGHHEQTEKIKQEEIKEGQKYEFDGQSNNQFNGIIQHLRGTENKIICDLGIIDVTASSYQSNHPPKNVVDFDHDNYFLSNGGYAWIQFDFKDKKVRPTRYSIKTRNNSDDQNPISWFIEVSNTGQDDDWRIIDIRRGNTSVSKRNQTDTFDISTQLVNNESYRYLRFRPSCRTSGGCDCLAISSLEFFGYLIE